MDMVFTRKLPIPLEVKEKYPLSLKATENKAVFDQKLADIFKGNSEKLVLIIGPCSADAEEPVMAYVHKLARLQEQVSDKILLVPRIYTNKPRTTGDGYKGMLHQPDPNGKPDVFRGILAIRALHARALSETGMGTADEMLYPANHRYLSDILSYVAVGARSVENQEHRLVASGLGIPTGMKNPTGGDLSIMMNALHAASQPHSFIYRGWAVETPGNPFAHAILRGYVDVMGHSHPNYHYEDLIYLADLYQQLPELRPGLIVDTNHANSGKQYLEQPRIVKSVLHSARHSESIRTMLRGFMIESYLEDGAQNVGEGCFGKSITDPCLGWEKTEKLVLEIADLI
ncbi:MAG: 3-deoxy-7-phosphoheptulonate synthase [Clostridia bacterium]|nr:3-deoxy-7-phosphoheptulonate synthase [Clostridia bacterium]MBQ7727635.1 3-deoxy-7-phosphoheptulonate synthase [Clostridia bacterium]